MLDKSFVDFESFTKTGLVRQCFSTRLGGVSSGRLGSLNLGFSRGDNRQSVLENYRILSEKMGFKQEDMVYSNQVHGIAIQRVDKSDKGRFPDNNHIKNIDGLITNQKNVVLVTFYADCVPLYFLDPVKKVIALSHAGWRGTVNAIGRITVEKMQKEYNSSPEHILVGIGPSIGRCCFEVDTPVAKEFEKLPEAVEFIYKLPYNNKFSIDLWAVNKNILVKSGILPHNIEVSGLCTKCHPELFYSHRLMGTERGSMAAFLELI